ncbi:hypothetical protein R4Z09_23000 [Niallia oryzisoli]|uniref:UDP-glucose 4-epimerase n=1 Tax=Niallia oryzisoli TaxID=1737571 RepID=A0ABZ2C8V9_9BACI
MDKAVIIGAYEFIGFHLCLSLLEKGVEVIGIHLPSLHDDDYLEEKRLSVGRNSNFIEKDETFFEPGQSLLDNSVLFIDYYSYYRMHKENELESMINQSIVNGAAQCILIVPVQLSNKTFAADFPLQLVKRQKDFQIYYLPTVYGPWQPHHFTFQKALLNPDKPLKIDKREWTNDALFISDVITRILAQVEKKENLEILLESSINDHWYKAASTILKNTTIEKTNEELKVNEDIVVLQVDGTILSEGVETQKRHLVRLKQLK